MTLRRHFERRVKRQLFHKSSSLLDLQLFDTVGIRRKRDNQTRRASIYYIVSANRDKSRVIWTSFDCPFASAMITRRRDHRNTALGSLEIEVSSAVSTIEDFASFPEEFPARDVDKMEGMELEEILGIEDLEWNIEPTSPIFDVELGDLCGGENEDSASEVAFPSSPDAAAEATLKMGSKRRLANQAINKNAIAARLNRLKKKEYVDSLEKKVGIMSTENSTLKRENSHLSKRVEELEDETRAPTQTTTTTPCHGNA
ncbi:uncharacterized protein crebzf [Stigmatopora argus]